MTTVRTVSFTNICLNGKVLDSQSHRNHMKCEVFVEEGQYFLGIRIAEEIDFEAEVRNSLALFQCSKWDPGADVDPIVDFTFSLRTVPQWMVPHTEAPEGCLQWVYFTAKLKESRQNYLAFTHDVGSLLSPPQWNRLDHEDALIVWRERSAPKVMKVTGVNIRLPLFQSFSVDDLKRLKDDKSWLSDSHVTFSLLDCYRHHSQRNTWGDLKITLLDTVFWTKMSQDADGYNERFRVKVNLVGYDFVVMPMFEDNHWKLGIVEKPGELIEGNTVFHILDSLPIHTVGRREASRLQDILLKHFEDAEYEERRIRVNLVNVPRQLNSIDCGLFLIYFGRKFLSSPLETLALMKNSFPSPADMMAAWGLKNGDMSFVRGEITALLFRYLAQGDAVVEHS